jgi:hypothetical protein
MASDLERYAAAFLLTVVVEVSVALVLGFRRRSEIVAVIWVNVFTHPLLNFLLWTVVRLRSASVAPWEILLPEVGVVLVEWQLLCYALCRHSRSRLFLLSVTMNAASYFGGSLLLV